MNNRQKAQKIKSDLETRFDRAQFSVVVRMGGDVSVNRIGGYDYAAEFPDPKAAVKEMVKVIRKTIPNFQWTDYTDPTSGNVVYR